MLAAGCCRCSAACWLLNTFPCSLLLSAGCCMRCRLLAVSCSFVGVSRWLLFCYLFYTSEPCLACPPSAAWRGTESHRGCFCAPFWWPWGQGPPCLPPQSSPLVPLRGRLPAAVRVPADLQTRRREPACPCRSAASRLATPCVVLVSRGPNFDFPFPLGPLEVVEGSTPVGWSVAGRLNTFWGRRSSSRR